MDVEQDYLSILFETAQMPAHAQNKNLLRHEKKTIEAFLKATEGLKNNDPLADAKIKSKININTTSAPEFDFDENGTRQFYFQIFNPDSKPEDFTFKWEDGVKLFPAFNLLNADTSNKKAAADTFIWKENKSIWATAQKIDLGKNPDVKEHIIPEGAWFGTIDFDLDLGVFDKLYPVANPNSLVKAWEEEYESEMRRETIPCRIMTLEEMIALGAVISAIETKTKSAFADEERGRPAEYDISYEFKNKDRVIHNIKPISMAEAGFQKEGLDECVLEKIHKSWVKNILNWIRDSFFQEYQFALRNKLKDLDMAPFRSGRLFIGDGETCDERRIPKARRTEEEIHKKYTPENELARIKELIAQVEKSITTVTITKRRDLQ